MDAYKPFTCDVCSESFWQKREMIKHNSLHYKTYWCDKCDKSFPLNSDLIAHYSTCIQPLENMDTHKPFACDVCEKSFWRKSQMTKHKRERHKKYPCDKCDTSFSQRSQLSNHEKSSAHLKRTQSLYSASNIDTFVDCGQTIKVEDIKEEIKEEMCVDNSFSIHLVTENSNVCEDIKKEIKEEESAEDSLSINHNSKITVKQEIKEEFKESDLQS